MILATSTLSSEKEPTAPAPFDFYPERRLSSSTLSPPPYESTVAEPSPFMHDEKHCWKGEQHISETCYQELPIRAGVKQIYAEHPSAFSRIPVVNTRALTTFDPLTILIERSGKSLDKGFSLGLPPSSESIHPFARRDIKASDWVRFMQDLKNGTAMSKCTKQKTLLIPLALGLGPGAFFISKAVKTQIRRKKLAYAINLIDTWNQHFFNPRSIEVILMRGSHPLTRSKSTARHLAYDSHCDDLAWVSRSAYHDSSSSPAQTEKSTGCRSQPKTPMRLEVVSI